MVLLSHTYCIRCKAPHKHRKYNQPPRLKEKGSKRTEINQRKKVLKNIHETFIGLLEPLSNAEQFETQH